MTCADPELEAALAAIFESNEIAELAGETVDYTRVPIQELLIMKEDIHAELIKRGEELHPKTERGRDYQSRYFAVVTAIEQKLRK